MKAWDDMDTPETRIRVLEVQHENLRGDVTEIKSDLGEVKDAVLEMKELLIEVKGAWKATGKFAVFVGGMAGMVSPFIHKLFPFLGTGK